MFYTQLTLQLMLYIALIKINKISYCRKFHHFLNTPYNPCGMQLLICIINVIQQTMITIENTKRKNNFILGLFKSVENAEKTFNGISQNKSFKIFEFKSIIFPFYVFEEDAKFKYIQTKDEVLNYLKSIKIKDDIDFDDCYCSLFIIKKEFASKKDLLDRMGVLEHIHIDNRVLKNLDNLFSDL